MVKEGFHVLTYKKGRSRPEPRKSFCEVSIQPGVGFMAVRQPVGASMACP
jgi:hypothetical protein